MATIPADNTVGATVRRLRSKLLPLYGRGETNSMIRLMFRSVLGWTQTEMLVNDDRDLSPYILGKLAEMEGRLLRHEPIQYVTGLAYFYGMDFEVRPGVLVPRPETAELVDIIVKENSAPDLHVLDACTGSGCIAVALARNLLFPEVTALDVSSVAMEVAEANARSLHARGIRFIRADIFKWAPEPASYDIMASNPPYVDESEREEMEPNVLDYEPPEALFVPDDDPLRFYERIAFLAKSGLKPGGRLYFEINPRHADEMRHLAEGYGFSEVALRYDSFGKPRFLSCRQPHTEK